MRIYKEFCFEAAHHLPHLFPPGHPNHRLHGHSFRVRVTLEGRPDPQTALIQDFGEVEAAIKDAREALDHRYLNEDVPGLERPSLELITQWIWRRLRPQLPNLAEIGVFRDSCSEGCVYVGELEQEEAV